MLTCTYRPVYIDERDQKEVFTHRKEKNYSPYTTMAHRDNVHGGFRLVSHYIPKKIQEKIKDMIQSTLTAYNDKPNRVFAKAKRKADLKKQNRICFANVTEKCHKKVISYTTSFKWTNQILHDAISNQSIIV